MSFKSNFYGPGNRIGMTVGEIVLGNTLDSGLTSVDRRLELIPQKLESSFNKGIARFQESQEASTQAIADEIRYQTLELLEGLSNLSTNVTQTLLTVGDYLGAEISQVRWAVDQNTAVTQQLLDVHLKSHWNNSRQFYEVGVQCYLAGERELAKAQFDKAVEASVNNSFAYQYLGFLATDADDQQQALLSFDRAVKFAPDAHQRALAHYHLERAMFAVGDYQKALENAQQALGFEPDNKTYQYELVHALMHAENIIDAIAQLRDLIQSDWSYWSICAIDRTLEPIRTEINALLAQMREEQRAAAKNLLYHFEESIQLLEELEKATDQVALVEQISSAKEVLSNLRKLYETGIVFTYRTILNSARAAHGSVIQRAVDSFQNAIGKCRENCKRAQATYIRETAKRDLPAQELLDQGEKKNREADDNERLGKERDVSGARGIGCSTLIIIAILLGIASVVSMNAENPLHGGDWGPIVVFSGIGGLIAFALLRYYVRPFRRKRETSALREEGRKLKAKGNALRQEVHHKNAEDLQVLRGVEADNEAIESILCQRAAQVSRSAWCA
jgi:tetratricopeptide (TPR) repeat protein